jgi:hypothetical protein
MRKSKDIEKSEVKSKKLGVWEIVVVVLLLTLILIDVYFVWSATTVKISGEIECYSRNITYIEYNVSIYQRNPNCIKAVEGTGFAVCALPQDLYCKGTLQNFPIVRAFVEALK